MCLDNKKVRKRQLALLCACRPIICVLEYFKVGPPKSKRTVVVTSLPLVARYLGLGQDRIDDPTLFITVMSK